MTGRVMSVSEPESAALPAQTEPWTWCPQHPPTDVSGPHGFMDCEERERRFRDMLAACAGDMSRYGRVEDLGAAVLNAAGGHIAAGFCSARHDARAEDSERGREGRA